MKGEAVVGWKFPFLDLVFRKPEFLGQKLLLGEMNAFRKKSEREKLPNSINGLWKADLFVGKSELDQWVGTTVKINPAQLEGAKGLRLAIIPAKYEKSDKFYFHETKKFNCMSASLWAIICRNFLSSMEYCKDVFKCRYISS